MLRSFLLKRWVLVVAIVAYALAEVCFAFTVPSLHGQLDGLQILDVRTPFMADEGFIPWDSKMAAAVLDTLGEAGRQEYYRFLLYPDMAYSVLISPLFFMVVVARLYDGRIVLLGALPGVLDTLENLSVLALLTSYPLQPSFATSFGPYFTAVKFISIAATFLAIVGGVLIKLRVFLRRRSTAR